MTKAIIYRNKASRDAMMEAIQFARKHSLKESLSLCLNRLRNMSKNLNGKVEIWKDFSPMSFNWGVFRQNGDCILYGGMIYHGPHDGYGSGAAPTFSVSLSSEHGWQLHT